MLECIAIRIIVTHSFLLRFKQKSIICNFVWQAQLETYRSYHHFHRYRNLYFLYKYSSHCFFIARK